MKEKGRRVRMRNILSHCHSCITFCHLQMFLLTFIVRDVSIEILDEFRKRPKMTLPDVNCLKEHIDKELDIKIPLLQADFDGLISTDLEDPCLADDLEILFRISETEYSHKLSC